MQPRTTESDFQAIAISTQHYDKIKNGRPNNLSETIESRLTEASITDLERWTDRVLEAQTINDVFS